MAVLTLDDAVSAVLLQAKQQTELRDKQGNLLGFFTPPRSMPLTARATEAELAELERHGGTEEGGKTLREIFEHLTTLTKNPRELADLNEHIQQLVEEE